MAPVELSYRKEIVGTFIAKEGVEHFEKHEVMRAVLFIGNKLRVKDDGLQHMFLSKLNQAEPKKTAKNRHTS